MATQDTPKNDPKSETAPEWLRSVLEKLEEQSRQNLEALASTEPLGFV